MAAPLSCPNSGARAREGGCARCDAAVRNPEQLKHLTDSPHLSRNGGSVGLLCCGGVSGRLLGPSLSWRTSKHVGAQPDCALRTCTSSVPVKQSCMLNTSFFSCIYPFSLVFDPQSCESSLIHTHTGAQTPGEERGKVFLKYLMVNAAC